MDSETSTQQNLSPMDKAIETMLSTLDKIGYVVRIFSDDGKLLTLVEERDIPDTQKRCREQLNSGHVDCGSCKLNFQAVIILGQLVNPKLEFVFATGFTKGETTFIAKEEMETLKRDLKEFFSARKTKASLGERSGSVPSAECPWPSSANSDVKN